MLSYIITILFIINNFLIILIQSISIFFMFTGQRVLDNITIMQAIGKYGFILAFLGNFVICISTYFMSKSNINKFYKTIWVILISYKIFWLLSFVAQSTGLYILDLTKGEDMYILINGLALNTTFNLLIAGFTICIFSKKEKIKEEIFFNKVKYIVKYLMVLIVYIGFLLSQITNILYK